MSTPPQGQNPFAQNQATYGQQPPPPQGGYGYPPQQGQPGQPGMPPQPSPYFNQGAPPPAQQQRPRRSWRTYLRIAGAIIGVIVIVGGWYASQDDANTASVGDCMHKGSSNPSDPDLEVVDCTSSNAQYKVLAKIKGNYTEMSANQKCKDEASDFQYTYTETGGDDDFLLCLKEYSG